MSQKSQPAICPVCNQNRTKRSMVRHIREKHQEYYKQLEKEFESKTLECPTCLKTFLIYENVNFFYFDDPNRLKFCSRECTIPWTKGKTKWDDPRLMSISQGRLGENNPIHKVLNDPIRKKEWLSYFYSDENKERIRKYATIPLADRVGAERAKEIHERITATWRKNGKPRGMVGKKHSEETKEKLRKTTSAWVSRSGRRSKLEIMFFEKIKERFPTYDWQSSFLSEHYTIDIALEGIKLAIEVDGDFFHCNEQQGFFCKTKVQKRNLRNDKAKNTYLGNRRWTLLRIWEFDINNNLEEQFEKIQRAIDEITKNK